MMELNKEVYRNLLEELNGLKQEGKTVMIAIDGRCASGKSTLGKALAEDLKAELLHMDDFYLQKHQRTPERYAEPGGNVDRERVAEVLTSLKEGKDTDYQLFDHRTFSLGETVTARCTPLIIVEGSYSHHPELKHFFERRIFITLDPEVQLARLAVRNPDKLEDFKNRWIPLEEHYFTGLDVAAHADLVLSTTQGSSYRTQASDEA